MSVYYLCKCETRSRKHRTALTSPRATLESRWRSLRKRGTNTNSDQNSVSSFSKYVQCKPPPQASVDNTLFVSIVLLSSRCVICILMHSVSPQIQCSKCELVWCFRCHAPWHEGLKCREYRKGDKLLRNWASVVEHGQRNAQKCPNCKVEHTHISLLQYWCTQNNI